MWYPLGIIHIRSLSLWHGADFSWFFEILVGRSFEFSGGTFSDDLARVHGALLEVRNIWKFDQGSCGGLHEKMLRRSWRAKRAATPSEHQQVRLASIDAIRVLRNYLHTLETERLVCYLHVHRRLPIFLRRHGHLPAIEDIDESSDSMPWCRAICLVSLATPSVAWWRHWSELHTPIFLVATLSLTRGPAGIRTTTGTLSAPSRTALYRLSHEAGWSELHTPRSKRRTH